MGVDVLPFPGPHRRAYRLGYGYTVEFSFRGGAQPRLDCEWSPAVPRIDGKGARERFLARYTAARDDFLGEVAHLIGGSVMAVDLDEDMRVSGLTGIEAPNVS